MGDWIGREARGGQAWLTYHVSGNQSFQLEYLNKKTSKDFIPGAVTQNSIKATFNKRVGRDFELTGWYQFERWKAPVYLSGPQNNSTGTLQMTYVVKRHTD